MSQRHLHSRGTDASVLYAAPASWPPLCQIPVVAFPYAKKKASLPDKESKLKYKLAQLQREEAKNWQAIENLELRAFELKKTRDAELRRQLETEEVPCRTPCGGPKGRMRAGSPKSRPAKYEEAPCAEQKPNFRT